jgi:hypothetical protein
VVIPSFAGGQCSGARPVAKASVSPARIFGIGSTCVADGGLCMDFSKVRAGALGAAVTLSYVCRQRSTSKGLFVTLKHVWHWCISLLRVTATLHAGGMDAEYCLPLCCCSAPCSSLAVSTCTWWAVSQGLCTSAALRTAATTWPASMGTACLCTPSSGMACTQTCSSPAVLTAASRCGGWERVAMQFDQL